MSGSQPFVSGKYSNPQWCCDGSKLVMSILGHMHQWDFKQVCFSISKKCHLLQLLVMYEAVMIKKLKKRRTKTGKPLWGLLVMGTKNCFLTAEITYFLLLLWLTQRIFTFEHYYLIHSAYCKHHKKEGFFKIHLTNSGLLQLFCV